MPYTLSLRARRDIDRMALELARIRGQTSTDRMLDRLQITFDMLGDHPMAGRDRSDDLGSGRRSSVSDLCIVVHRAFGHDVLIERVIDGRRHYPALFRP